MKEITQFFFLEDESPTFKLLLLIQNIRKLHQIKCRSGKMINIPWFLVSHLYLLHLYRLSVQSYKRLKLRAFQE